MAIGAFLEPLIVVSLLGGGTLINRETTTGFNSNRSSRWNSPRAASPAPRIRKSNDDDPAGRENAAGLGSWAYNNRANDRSTMTSFDSDDETVHDPSRQMRTLRFWKWRRNVITPNTEVFKDRLLSRVLRKFPFLVEAWYWALIYWVYQLGRAFSAVFIIDESVVDVARRHALQLVHIEQRLGIFIELPIQQYFMQHPTLMHWINRIYSFIHIPGTITFLVVLFYLTTTRPARQLHKAQLSSLSSTEWHAVLRKFNPGLYEKRRRTMAMCNLMAFVIFTAWPCMPPRLLSDQNLAGSNEEALSYGFVDTVHSSSGESSVWTTNKFCNQYAAMPSLHFGYSFLIGLTIASLPLENTGRYGMYRILLVTGAMLYPATILTAIIATANHFVLDAVVGAMVCGLVWQCNGFLLNLLPLEDYFLWALRIHKPSKALTNEYHKLSQHI
ncbi:integral membrane protein [Ophiostoma piceae UAMH 11346]|uniref:Integral membrane protein n=1 Tax=Ophiostoma piceae (strain UAMH 11346) TaxID=1262450 RepID=S3D2R6_OPHP1|nr:integral membrane protein [Ophiostoma piceae UAMH 11346]